MAPVKFFESLPEEDKKPWVEAAVAKRKEIEEAAAKRKELDTTAEKPSLKPASEGVASKPAKPKSPAPHGSRPPTAYQLWRTAVAGRIIVPAGQTILEVYNKLPMAQKEPFICEADRQKALLAKEPIVIEDLPELGPSPFELWKRANPAVLAELKEESHLRPQVYYAQLSEQEREPYEEQVHGILFLLRPVC